MHVKRSPDTSMPGLPELPALVERIGDSGLAVRLVPVYERLSGILVGFVGADSPLRGDALGHALHPVLTDLPLGCWTSATILDLVGFKRSRPAATTLLAIGLVAAVPTAAAGLVDFQETRGRDRRIAAVHAAGNSAAVLCYAASLRARLRGRHFRGVVDALAGAALTAGAGHLGGHLALNQGLAARLPTTPDAGLGKVPAP
jgi:uncharacterized membrane protein